MQGLKQSDAQAANTGSLQISDGQVVHVQVMLSIFELATCFVWEVFFRFGGPLAAQVFFCRATFAISWEDSSRPELTSW